MSDLSLRLQELRNLRGITRKALSDATGLTVQALATYENGTATPPFETMRVLAMFYNVDPKYLMGYKDSYVDKETDDDYAVVSVFKCLPFGTPPQAVSSFDGMITAKKADLAKNSFAVRVRDESMYPYLQEKDAVIVNTDLAPADGNIVLAFTDNTFAKFFFYKEDGDFVKLSYPAHSKMAPVVLPRRAFRKDGKSIVGVAVSLFRNYMEVD